MDNKCDIIIIVILSIILSGCLAPSATQENQSPELYTFTQEFTIDPVLVRDVNISITENNTLRVKTGHSIKWPGITLKAQQGKWDLSSYEYITAEIMNPGSLPVRVYCRVDNPGADGVHNCVTDSITLGPGEEGTLSVQIFPSHLRLSKPVKLIGMRGTPAYSGKINPANIIQLVFFVHNPVQDYVFDIKKISAAGSVETLNAGTFFPFIDEFGQFIHKNWPGKTYSQKDLDEQKGIENLDLTALPGPKNRNKYGGWISGPKLKATGFFRCEKYKDRWWLVDPLGRLFWSLGIDCVGSTGSTPITDREYYFSKLPVQGSVFSQFYGKGYWAPNGYYKDHLPYKIYDFGQANLLRKYGKDWQNMYSDIIHQRLKSWGINTIANWSDRNICLMRKTPYVFTIGFDSRLVRELEGSEGYWNKFYDVFDPGFRDALHKALESEENRTIDDPWCIGYFVHNELPWGDDISLSIAALVSPPDQPAKKEFLQDLMVKYGTIDKLNAEWGAFYESWQDLLQVRKAPDAEKARADLEAFYTKTAETYFEIVSSELKTAAPNQLYLGCRFAWVNDTAARAAAMYCDIISYNRYDYSVADDSLPDNIDRPIIIGEFHFGALDRGLFHAGLKRTADQSDRGAKFKSYVMGALSNPYIVGVHWFQYRDQCTTGRGDGENYQIGFIDICDKPYTEIVSTCREVGYNLYTIRLPDE